MTWNQLTHFKFIKEQWILSTFFFEINLNWISWLHNLLHDRLFQFVFIWCLINRKRWSFFAVRSWIFSLGRSYIFQIIFSISERFFFFFFFIICIEYRWGSRRDNNWNNLGVITVELFNFKRKIILSLFCKRVARTIG